MHTYIFFAYILFILRKIFNTKVWPFFIFLSSSNKDCIVILFHFNEYYQYQGKFLQQSLLVSHLILIFSSSVIIRWHLGISWAHNRDYAADVRLDTVWGSSSTIHSNGTSMLDWNSTRATTKETSSTPTTTRRGYSTHKDLEATTW